MTPPDLYIVFKDGEIIGTHLDVWPARDHVDKDCPYPEHRHRYEIVKYSEQYGVDL